MNEVQKLFDRAYLRGYFILRQHAGQIRRTRRRFRLVVERAGEFVVEIDVVQAGIAWFAQKGSKPARLKIKVE